ncbi:MAG: preprotein translocase subunit SecG [Candidatus Andersenbacteria bacterium]
MDNVLLIAQMVTAGLLVVSVLIQPKGVGLGQVFGGEGNVYRTKRGAEKIVFYATIIFAVAFAGLALTRVLIA